jgi:2-haloacid dehalogenase
MDHDRREFLGLTAAAVGATLLAGPARAAVPRDKARIKAVAFDGFPIIDPRPVAALAEELFPGRGGELMNAWRTRQFEYTWLRTVGGRYADFWHVTEDALAYAAGATKLDVGLDKRKRLMDAFLALNAWPDVPPVLAALRKAGVRMAFLSNFTAHMLDAAVANAGLREYFEPHLTTDLCRAYKPDPRAYQLAMDAFKLDRAEIAFVASASWDAAGARWFGYPTIWINRMGLPAEELGVAADVTCDSPLPDPRRTVDVFWSRGRGSGWSCCVTFSCCSTASDRRFARTPSSRSRTSPSDSNSQRSPTAVGVPGSALSTDGSGYRSAGFGPAGPTSWCSSSPRRSSGGIARGSVATGHGSRIDAAQVDRRSIRKSPS